MAATRSGNELLKQQAGMLTSKEPERQTFQSMLEKMKPEFAKVLPRALTAERLIRIALTEVRKNPTLGTCDMQSVVGAIMIGAQLGLEPGIMGQAYLVPFNSSFKENGEWKKKMVCTFIPGWQGYVDLVSRSGRASVWTGAVYEGDEFEAQMGSNPYVNHIPDYNADNEGRKLLYVYAVGRQQGSDTPVVDVWGVSKVKAHRARYNKVGDKHYSFKDDNNFEMYARKLPLLQVVKYLPKSVELQLTANLDHAAETGTQALTIQGVKDEGPIEAEPLELGESNAEGEYDFGLSADELAGEMVL